MFNARHLVLAMSVGILTTASALGSAVAETTIKLHYAYPQVVKPIHDLVIEEFGKTNPDVKVEVMAPANDYDEQMQVVLRGTITDDLPDIVFVGPNWTPVVAARGIAGPIDDLVSAESDWEARGYGAGMMRMGKFDGHVYGLPLAISTPVLYYNVDLVKQAGGDPDNFPRDWDGIFDLAAKIKALGSDIEGIHLTRNPGNWYLQTLVQTHGGKLISGDESAIGFNDEIGLASLRVFDRAVKDGGMLDTTRSAARQNFAAGKQGITWNSTAQIVRTIKNVDGRFAFRTAPLPTPVGPEKALIAAGGNVGAILTKDPAKRQAAWDYLKLATSAWGGEVVVKNSGYMAPNQLLADDPAYLGDFYKENPNFATALEQLPMVTPFYAYPGDNGLKINKAIHDRVNEVVAQRMTPEDALSEMSAEVAKLLGK